MFDFLSLVTVGITRLPRRMTLVAYVSSAHSFNRPREKTDIGNTSLISVTRLTFSVVTLEAYHL
jgi:hypothetical protein